MGGLHSQGVAKCPIHSYNQVSSSLPRVLALAPFVSSPSTITFARGCAAAMLAHMIAHS
jgi:hypothetical protein